MIPRMSASFSSPAGYTESCVAPEGKNASRTCQTISAAYLSLVVKVLEALQCLLQNICNALLLHAVPLSLRATSAEEVHVQDGIASPNIDFRFKLSAFETTKG